MDLATTIDAVGLGPPARTVTQCAIDQQGCVSCGARDFGARAVIDDALARSWALTPRERDWFDDREGHHCLGCGMSRRVRMLLWALRWAKPNLAGCDLLHINQVNHLAPALSDARVTATAYRRDESAAETPLGAVGSGPIHQDLQAMTFDDARFDLVIHSETLEHVLDPSRALAEARRVLRPGGRQVYTVPLLHDRATRRRAWLDDAGRLEHRMPPSFHGCEAEDLVVWELGGEFLAERAPMIEWVFYDDASRNPTVFAVIERKGP